MKEKLFTTLVALLSVFCLGALPIGSACAEDAPQPAVWPQISPVTKRLRLTAGAAHDGEFTVKNIGSADFSFSVYASPYNVVGDNYELNFTNETRYTQVARWIKFEQSQFDLAAGAEQIIKFRVEVPEEVPSGGQYAVIFAEASGQGGSSDVNDSGIKTVNRVGMVVYADLGGETAENAELVTYSVPGLYLSGNISTASKIRNNGNTDFTANYHMDVRPIIGDIVYQEDESHAILPDSERRLEMMWDKTPLLGLFKVNYSITAPGIDRNETRLVLVIPVFVLVITLLLLTFGAIWITLTIKRRRGLREKMQISK